jgi:hypothetical protein
MTGTAMRATTARIVLGIVVLAFGLVFVATGVSAAPPPGSKGEAQQECNSNYAAYGFSTKQECKQYVAKHGSLSPTTTAPTTTTSPPT